MGYLDNAKAIHTRFYPKEAARVVPCTEEEIGRLERLFGLRLPKAYREFLLWMGKDGIDFWAGYDCFYNKLHDINDWARKLIQSSQTHLSLSRDAFIFFWDPARSFYFFQATQGDDPAVYFFMDPNLENVLRQTTRLDDLSSAQSYLAYLFDNSKRAGFVMRARSFSECLVSEMEDHVRIRGQSRFWR
jgi:hypothetical protein